MVQVMVGQKTKWHYFTQISTWKKLQTIDGHKNDCGRPRINGGYIENKMLDMASIA